MSSRLPDLRRAVALFHHRWAVPVLGALDQHPSRTIADLSESLGASRDAVRQALHSLERGALVEARRPLVDRRRLEWSLTPRGQSVASRASDLTRLVGRHGVRDAALRKWAMTTLLVVGAGHRRYSDIHRHLPGASPRALTAALKSLERAGLVTRCVVPGYPPTTSYEVTRIGSHFVEPLRAFAAVGAALADTSQGET